MKFVAEIQGTVSDYLKRENEAGARAASGVMKNETRALQLALRSQVNSAFGAKGRGIGNAWRSQTYPRKPNLGAAGLVWSKTPAIIDAFEKGAMIRPRQGGKYLAVPTGYNTARGRRGGKVRVTPQQMVAARGEAFVIRSKSNPKVRLWCLRVRAAQGINKKSKLRAFVGPNVEVLTGKVKNQQRLVRETLKQGFVPMFLLLESAKLQKKLDIRKPANSIAAGIPAKVAAAWDKEARNVRP